MTGPLHRAQVRTREMFWRWVVLWCGVAAVMGIAGRCTG